MAEAEDQGARPPVRLVRRWVSREILALLVVVGLPSLLNISVFGLAQIRLSEVAIDGQLERVPRDWIDERLVPFQGSHLLALSLPAVQQRLQAHPWIAVVELRKELPHRLRLILRERRPAALLTLQAGQIVVVDAAGRLIAPLRAGQEELTGSLPMVRAARPERVGTALAIAHAAAPRHGRLGEVRELRMLTDESWAIRFAALPFPVVVDSRDLVGSFRRLDLVLPEVQRRYRRPAGLDVSFPDEAFLTLGTGQAGEAFHLEE